MYVHVARQYHEAGRVSSELKQLRAELEAQRQQVWLHIIHVHVHV